SAWACSSKSSIPPTSRSSTTSSTRTSSAIEKRKISAMEQSLAATLWRLAGLVALVGANGLFGAAEFSIVTVRKTRIDQMIAEGHRGARALRRAVSAPDRYIAATQLGITMASLGLGWLAEPALASIFQPALTFLPPHIAEQTAHSIAIAIAFAIITAAEI